MFDEELQRIKAWRKNRGIPENDGDPRLDLIGLAFSGGGIRSATFNLGVLQALAKLEILRYVDYLSTVSGGGYIGGWLTGMIHRLGAGGMKEVEDGLDPGEVNKDNLPQKAIAHLRAFSNYLTPKVSALSADTWSLFSIWSRNTLLNLVTLVAGIAALILFGRLVGLTSMVTKWPAALGWSWAAFAVAAVTLALTLRVWLPRKYCKDSGVQRLVVLPAFAGALLMTFAVYACPITDWVLPGIVLSVLFFVLQLLAGFWGWFLHHHQNKGALVLDGLLQLSVAAVSGFVASWLFYAVSFGVQHFNGLAFAPWLVLTVGPPAMLAAVSLGVIVNVGLMGRDIPDDTREWLGRLGAWAMIYGAGWLLFFSVAFLGPLGLKAGWSAFANWAKATVTLAWVGTTMGSLLAAKGAKTGSDQGGGTMNLVALAGPWVFLLGFVSLIGLGVHELTLGPPMPPPATGPTSASAPAAPALASATAKVTQSGSTITVTFDSQGGPKKEEVSLWCRYWDEMQVQIPYIWPWKNPGGISWYKGLLDVMLLAVAIALLMAWRVDINEFSLHHFYKNRLVRCYLGASRERKDRHANPFTNFDLDDDFPLNHLDDPNFSGPFPIINATLNLSSGRNLAWQERKGASFIFTPVYSGYDTGRDDSGTSNSRRMRVGGDADGGPPPAGYYPTQLVAKTEYKAEPDEPETPADAGAAARFTNDGIMMGTTVAISGAAANPNQGYHTSTAVAFLMSVFDVRLGWWLGNPAGPDRTASSNGPTFGLGYTLAELFGTTSADSAFVNLSDGGHFDNMGLYELVRRKCRYIILCDAEQDGDLHFGGLSTAIRMCRTDFGAKIDINVSQLARKPDNKPESFSGCHYAIGDITYANKTTGRLVYLKSSLTGDEPADVLGYHNQVAQFPHESTADQWFDESQFESYRALGYHIADKALGDGRAPLSAAKTKQDFFGALKGCVDPPKPAPDQAEQQ